MYQTSYDDYFATARLYNWPTLSHGIWDSALLIKELDPRVQRFIISRGQKRRTRLFQAFKQDSTYNTSIIGLKGLQDIGRRQ